MLFYFIITTWTHQDFVSHVELRHLQNQKSEATDSYFFAWYVHGFIKVSDEVLTTAVKYSELQFHDVTNINNAIQGTLQWSWSLSDGDRFKMLVTESLCWWCIKSVTHISILSPTHLSPTHRCSSLNTLLILIQISWSSPIKAHSGNRLYQT